jgi:hypothetical protein
MHDSESIDSQAIATFQSIDKQIVEESVNGQQVFHPELLKGEKGNGLGINGQTR